MTLLSRVLTVAAVSALLVVGALPAFAHVTVRTDNAEPGGFSKYTIRVPNESEDAATISIELQLPEGYEESRYQPLAGWDISVADGVMTIEGGRIEVGEFQEFAFSARNPETPGDVVFPAIQTYEDGEEARWVGEPDADQPAPVVTIAAAGEVEEIDDEATEATGPTEAATQEPTEAVADTATEAAEDSDPQAGAGGAEVDGDDDGADPLSIVALIVGLLGLILGGAAFARARGTARA